MSYKYRSPSLDPKIAKQVITSNGIFRPTIVANGKVEGLWKRTLKKDHVLIEPHFFNSKNRLRKDALEEAIKHYEDFLGVKTIQ